MQSVDRPIAPAGASLASVFKRAAGTVPVSSACSRPSPSRARHPNLSRARHNGSLLPQESSPSSGGPRRRAPAHDRPPLAHMGPVGTLLDWVRFALRDKLSVVADDAGRCRWLAWTCDAIDFFSVSLSVTLLQDSFHKSAASIVSLIATRAFSPANSPARRLLSRSRSSSAPSAPSSSESSPTATAVNGR
jgi:hypothetical protein